MALWRRTTKYVRIAETCSDIFSDDFYFPGEEYDISEAEQAELDEKLNEINDDISEDDKIADDVEKMIQQQVNVSQKSLSRKENIIFNLIFSEFPSIYAEHDQGLESLAQELLQLLRTHRARHRHCKQGRQRHEDWNSRSL